MRAKCLKTFRDMETGELRKFGSTFETTRERLSAINSTRYGQLAREVRERASAKPRARQRRKSKGQ